MKKYKVCLNHIVPKIGEIQSLTGTLLSAQMPFLKVIIITKPKQKATLDTKQLW